MQKRKQTLRVSWVFLILATSSQSASAHLVSTRFGEYYSGLLHPLTTLTHLIPWIALAMMAMIQGKSEARINLLVFPVAVAIGVLLGVQNPGLAAPVVSNTVSLAILGAMLALARPLPTRAFIFLCVALGLSHGYANSVAGLDAWDLSLYVMGVASAAYLLIALLGAASVSLGQFPWGRVAVRAIGSWILASGLLFSVVTLVGVQGV